MLPLVSVDGVDTAIIGWAPGKNGQPMAMVPWENPDGTYGCRAVALGDFTFTRLPEKLTRRLRKQSKRRVQFEPEMELGK